MSPRRPRPSTDDPLAADVARLVAGEHGDPHQILGLHKDESGTVVRVFRPGAASVAAVVGGKAHPLAQQHEAGLFASPVPDSAAEGYRLAVTYPDGTTLDIDDAYRFWPTFGELDLHLAGEGRHEDLWRLMGAHPRRQQEVDGVSFAVWAPNARAVRVVGDFNLWDGRLHAMRSLGRSGIWEIFIPDIGPGERYKFELVTADGGLILKADPYAFATEIPPGTASVVASEGTYSWGDRDWMQARESGPVLNRPGTTYEMHLGSWRVKPGEGNRPLTYREMADVLPDYLSDMGFTHVEMLPVAEHPYAPSWGYQVSSYYAPSARFGSPDDFRHLVDALHRRGIGVIVDWVPAHFPKDDWALARFDGTALYEHADPRQGEHPDWGTLVFNFGRNEVRNFLIANALFWLEEFHIDGLRVDAVASMLYLDYSREEGEWVPNQFGGRENLDAVSFLQELNVTVYARHPGAITVAEESTAWPGVSRPTYVGGLGFGFKWNMGWMHDTLDYFQRDAVHRRFHHDQLTFGLLYAFTENFVLPLSHDEVVHGKRSLLGKMPGDRWQQLANLRALYGWMWAHPGKKLLFMGGELAQPGEWSHERSLDWHLLDYPEHRGVHDLVRALNRAYLDEPALWSDDVSPGGFRWIDASDTESNVLSFLRFDGAGARSLACVANLSPVPRQGYRMGLPVGGPWREVLNTDAAEFGGGGTGNGGSVFAGDEEWHGLPHSAELTLPPLSVLWLRPEA